MLRAVLGSASLRRAATRTAATLLKTNATVAASLDTHPSSRCVPFSVLVVGTDRRSGVGSDLWPAPRGSPAGPGRADAILLAVIDPVVGRVDALSVPRATAVEVPVVGYQRLGWALEYGGASALVTAAKRVLDVSIHHYVCVDFQGFAAIVDAVDGIQLDVEGGLRDRRTGLDLDPGDQHVGGRQALALVRSRYQESERDGRVRTTSLGDSGRRDRLRSVVHALATRLRAGIGLRALARLAMATCRHVVVDESLVRRLREDPALVSRIARECVVPRHLRAPDAPGAAAVRPALAVPAASALRRVVPRARPGAGGDGPRADPCRRRPAARVLSRPTWTLAGRVQKSDGSIAA